jgi:hypothetical protein
MLNYMIPNVVATKLVRLLHLDPVKYSFVLYWVSICVHKENDDIVLSMATLTIAANGCIIIIYSFLIIYDFVNNEVPFVTTLMKKYITHIATLTNAKLYEHSYRFATFISARSLFNLILLCSDF